MSQRLDPLPTEWIERDCLVPFSFEGSRYTGYAGDTVSSALWAAGQRVLVRSFKYHRPRGLLSFANHDVNTLMQADSQLSVRADVTPVTAGLNLAAVNTWGGVSRDRASLLNALSAFLPVGFYYKTFHGRFFPFWERTIRKLGGLSAIDPTAPRLRTPKQYDFCDVLVVGAGPSGLAAAIAAAEAGAEVVLVDENARAGGSGSYQLGGDLDQAKQTAELIQMAAAQPRIRQHLQTEAAGYYADGWVPLVEPERMTKLRAKAVIVASGAFEQPAVFHNNDLPGVMLASAAQRLIYRYAVKPMRRAVVLVGNSDGYRAALDLAANGVEVMAVVDLRAVQVSPEAHAIRAQGIPIFSQYGIYAAETNPAQDGVCAAVICPLSDTGEPRLDQRQTINCDGIVVSVGWAPAANLLYQAGTQMRFEERVEQFVPDRLPEGVFACGRVNGVYQFDKKLIDGRRAGLEAAAYLGFAQSVPSPVPAAESESPSHPWPVVSHPKGKNFVDFDEDLQLKDFYHAAQEGFDNIELLKRYTTVGMGPSQGKHSNMNALRILANINNKSPQVVGPTTARPFFHPVPFSHLAGRGFTPERHTPLYSRHLALSAEMVKAGLWQRPEFYRQSGFSRADCIRQEALNVRQRVGLIDVSSLGKLELRGPDAAEFLERLYTGRYQSLKSGRTRYALMLDESGVVMDDGVIARLGPEHFYFTTTTSGSSRIYREISRLALQWRFNCGIVNLTGARAAINLAGPRSQQVLSQLTSADLSAEAFPYLAVREAQVAGIPAILMRVGFVGEWGYEIHVPALSAPALWDALMQAGAADGIRPFGLQAQRLLRLEKGHVIVGLDTDGLTTPAEANLSWAVKSDKPFFLGQRSLAIVGQRSQSKTLVGFTLPASFTGQPPEECNLVIDQGEIAGRVTSIAFSPSLERYIGLAYVPPAQSADGTSLAIRNSDGAMIPATVSSTPCYDPDNRRQKESFLTEAV